ncbi:MAG: class I SAM-dependent methyltransferase [Actinomycetota bacterium]|nr:class I SAM-dependent methyltransferase [Actinomycetota bacterium]
MDRLEQAREVAGELDFADACDDAVGALLATLVADLPAGARVLELGTGTGVGLAWCCSGLGSRRDVRIVSVELDPSLHRRAARLAWPPSVQLLQGDAVALLPTLGAFALVFADAPGGKWEGLDRTVEAVAPGGVLVMDDMTPQPWWPPAHTEAIATVRSTLGADERLRVEELPVGSGVLLARRCQPGAPASTGGARGVSRAGPAGSDRGPGR